MRLLAIACALAAAFASHGANAQPLPDSVRAAGVSEAQWDAIRSEARAQARRADISEATLFAAAAAASDNLARSGRFDALSLQSVILQALSEQADQIALLQGRLETLTRESDETSAGLVEQARAALREGRLGDADALLAQAAEHDLAAIQRADDEVARRRTRAGETIASRAQIATLQSDYLTAAAHYARAAEIVPQSAAALRWAYLRGQAQSLYQRGFVFVEPDALREAARLLETSVLPLAPREARPVDWAATQVDLGWVRVRQGDRGGAIAWEQVEAALGDAVEIFRTADDRSGQALALRTLGVVNLTQYEAGAGDADAALQRAIVAYEAALALLPRETNLVAWGVLQMNLCGARHREGAAQQAVAACEAALGALTRESDPAGWAAAQNNLGNALRLAGGAADRESYRRAVAAYEAALTVWTRDANPDGWARAQYNLGLALQELGARGERGALERAVAAYEASLSIWTPATDAPGWADLQHHLGNTLAVLGERGEAGALERAVTAYDAALTIWTQENAPADWASAQHDLGHALLRLAERDTPGAIERAIAAYEAALTVRTREANPIDWARTQISLGNAQSFQGEQGVRGGLERAIESYEAALSVLSADHEPELWASAQQNLGIVFWVLGSRGRPGMLERALAAYEAALTLTPRDSDPNNWAALTFGVARTYRNMGRMEEAEAAARDALAGYEQSGNAFWANRVRGFLRQFSEPQKR